MPGCPNVLLHGSCSDGACQHDHTVLNCDTCQLIFSTATEHKAHLRSEKHKAKAAGIPAFAYCSICAINVGGGQKAWELHFSGRRHKAIAEDKGLSTLQVEPQAAQSTDRETHCELCQMMVMNWGWKRHIRTKQHLTREAFTKYKSALDEAQTDKNGVIIEGAFDVGFVEPDIAQAGMDIGVIIKTSVYMSKSVLVEIKIASARGIPPTVSPFAIGALQLPHKVTSRPPSFALSFKQAYAGRYEDHIEFVFEDTQLKQRYVIVRTLKAIVGNKVEHEALQPRAPYVPRPRSTRKAILEVVEGVKPPALNAVRYIAPLPRATIPANLQINLLSSEPTSKTAARIKKYFMPVNLDSTSYSRYFKHLLWIEEFKMEQDLERYDIMGATLDKHNQYHYLRVPGLAEKRPSVLVGDQIYVQEQGSINGRWFEGHVHVLRQTEVGLCFHGSFPAYPPAKRFHVRFKLNRIPVRRQHQAMDAVFTEERILFPFVNHLSGQTIPSTTEAPFRPYNTLISGNGPQRQAVLFIVSQRPGSLPFVVFGPPGTGKTMTIVEAIRQVLAANPHAKILACAPSNSAADLLASRLRVGLNTDELFRFYAPSRPKNQVPDDLLPCTYAQADGHFSVPLISRVKAFRVIVATCVSASFASGIGMPRGHFSHIFIDEAGQATEPEAFVSIKMMADNKTNIILSGDPKQLGPIIRSGVARQLGLEKSYLERLMERDVYDHRTRHGLSVVKLVKNFRSHNSILQFPNNRFYEGDLVPCAHPTVINAYLGSSYLPSKNFPIVFHSLSGEDDREASSPSFFNIDEVLQVKSYVQRLKEDRKFRTADKDIGVIAPYHAQCQKLRNTLRAVADGVKVGSVEEFQGQERKVIIISTVRSSKEFIEYDLRHTLGFVANPRRFNVAVTRAQALLIVVGDPQVLSLDPLWRSFLNYVYMNGGWTGPDITWDPRVSVEEAGGYDKAIRNAAKLDMNDFARRMETLTMAEVDDELDANVDRPWRNVE
ncbi:RNA helicase [Crassisporium funariophilum]|nr:RNA helicase [Crassisporium funariophilum]